jgi:hypothetical protein
MTLGSDFSGIFLIQLNPDNGKAMYAPERWTTDPENNPHWDLAKNTATATQIHSAGQIGSAYVYLKKDIQKYYLFATYGVRNGLRSTA